MPTIVCQICQVMGALPLLGCLPLWAAYRRGVESIKFIIFLHAVILAHENHGGSERFAEADAKDRWAMGGVLAVASSAGGGAVPQGSEPIPPASRLCAKARNSCCNGSGESG